MDFALPIYHRVKNWMNTNILPEFWENIEQIGDSDTNQRVACIENCVDPET